MYQSKIFSRVGSLPIIQTIHMCATVSGANNGLVVEAMGLAVNVGHLGLARFYTQSHRMVQEVGQTQPTYFL